MILFFSKGIIFNLYVNITKDVYAKCVNHKITFKFDKNILFYYKRIHIKLLKY